MANERLQAALDYARRGWHVFPCIPGGKRPAGALVPHGVKEATVDRATIKAWWSQEPSANIGLACGPSGLLVVDVDMGHADGANGLESWRDLALADGTPTAETPSGGLHLYYARDGANVGSTTRRLGPGLDTRGVGGYVVAPPSVTPSGVYDWAMGSGPDDLALLAMPAKLALLLAKPKRAAVANSQGPTRPTATRDLERARAALARLAPQRCQNYATWIECGMALFELGADGLALWDTWSELAPNYQEGACAKHWATFTRGGLGLGSLYHWADRDSPRAPTSRSEPTSMSEPDMGPEPDTEPDTETGAVGPEPPHSLTTDVANGERMIRKHGKNLRYCSALADGKDRGWVVWDGRRWAVDDLGHLERLAKATARGIYIEAGGQATEKARERLAKWAVASESRQRQAAMLAMAWSESGIPARPELFDALPCLLNIQNGTLNLQTGELGPHKRGHYITKLAPVYYDPGARDAAWDTYLSETTGGDADFAAYLQRAAGYSLTGLTGEEVVFMVLGDAATGKSTFVEALVGMLGDYAVKARFETFLRHPVTGGASPDLVALRGARFVGATEPDRGRALAEAQLKELSGGDTLTVRALYKAPFSYRPTFKLWLAANECPRLSDDDTGIWRRVRRVPFEAVVPEADRDPKLKAHLRDDPGARSAILAWAVVGCMAWQIDGLGTCEIVKERTAQLRLDFDPLATFFETCCVIGRTYQVPAADLRAAYEGWAKENGARPLGNKQWGTRLEAIGCQRQRLRGASVGGRKVSLWYGIGLQE